MQQNILSEKFNQYLATGYENFFPKKEILGEKITFLKNAICRITGIDGDITKHLYHIYWILEKVLVTGYEKVGSLRDPQPIIIDGFNPKVKSLVEYLIKDIKSSLDCANDDYSYAHCYEPDAIISIASLFLILNHYKDKFSQSDIYPILQKVDENILILDSELSGLI